MSECKSHNFLSKFGNQVNPLSVVDFIRIWRHYDTDKSGFIETEDKEDGSNEFRDFVKDFLQACLGQSESATVEETKQHLIKTFDRNNDGKFQLSEMIQLLPVENNFMAQFTKSNIGEEDFDRIFQHYDQDNSGKVEGDEIDGLIRDLICVKEEDGEDLTMEKIATMRQELLSVADLDGDGQLDKSELKHFILSGKRVN